MEDISKIPRIPGDGAQDEPEDSDKPLNKTQLECLPNSKTLRNNITNSEHENNESK